MLRYIGADSHEITEAGRFAKRYGTFVTAHVRCQSQVIPSSYLSIHEMLADAIPQ